MSLKVLAISAPQWVSFGEGYHKDSLSFGSQTPFSLQNALRDAVFSGETERSEVWSCSNLADLKSRQKAIMMIESWEDEKETFTSKFDEIQPHILFIGAMSLSFPGAIEIAKYARKKRNDRVLIVLGGKHTSETMFKSRFGGVKHHVGSPLMLMNDQVIPSVFDVIVSGDGEEVITMIGEVVGKILEKGKSLSLFHKYARRLDIEQAKGNWLIGMLTNSEFVYFQSQKSNPIDYSTLGLAADQYNLSSGFKIFGTNYTAHAYSDSSRGCAFNCFFCSEKFKVSGELRIKTDMSVNRLFDQFVVIRNKKTKGTTSIFVEDSIFLNGKVDHIETFVNRLKRDNICLPFGIQLTLDTFFSLPVYLLKELQECGLEYIAFGIETISEDLAQSLSKNSNKKVAWEDKIEMMVLMCADLKIKCGMFLIWGLNETQEMRLNQLTQIKTWVEEYKVPIDVGLNIATQHPLQIVDDTSLDQYNYRKHNYVKWGTESSDKYLSYFTRFFGEASIRYAIYPESIPTIQELDELIVIYKQIKNATYALVK